MRSLRKICIGATSSDYLHRINVVRPICIGSTSSDLPVAVLCLGLASSTSLPTSASLRPLRFLLRQICPLRRYYYYYYYYCYYCYYFHYYYYYHYYCYYYYCYYYHYYADFGTNCMVENDAPTEDTTLAYKGNFVQEFPGVPLKKLRQH